MQINFRSKDRIKITLVPTFLVKREVWYFLLASELTIIIIGYSS